MTNPYSATTVDLSEPTGSDEPYEPQIFAVNGRIGRLRYLAYSFVTGIVTVFIAGILAAILIPIFAVKGNKDSIPFVVIIMMLLIYIPTLASTFIMAKRRLNDLNQTGWLSLLMFVPFVNFIFPFYLIFAPGTKTSNNYGPPPIKNSALVVIGGLIFPFIAMIGILAAIAIPAYQDYGKRAKAAQEQSAVQAPERESTGSKGGGD